MAEEALADDPVIATALKRFSVAEQAEKGIREKSLKDLRFRAGEQWPQDIQAARILDKRPCLNINRLPQFIRQVTNDQRQNRPSLEFTATDDSTVDTAEVMNGLARHIQSSSNADIAFDTACDQQVTAGFGYFRLVTEYCDDASFDQEIKIKRIKNQFTVYFDPSAIEPDYSDAKWAFIVSDVDKDEFKGKDGVGYSDMSLSSIGDKAPGWTNGDKIRVAEYFEVVETEKTLYLLKDGTVTTEKPENKDDTANQRKTADRKVVWRKITALEELDRKEWPGRYIPIIPVLGDDLDIDGERRLTGMVRDAQDPQRMYNVWSSAITEAIALAPRAPFTAAEGQIENYKAIWDTANTRSWSHLPYKPISLNGTLVPPPMRNQAEPPVQAMSMALANADRDLMHTTGIYQAGLGQRSNETSGKAILSRQKEGDVANFHYIDNLSRAIRFLGVILLDLIPKIYDAPRVIRILHEDGEAEVVKINQLFEHKGKQVNYDLTVGKYDVAVNVGPSFTTKRQETADAMAQTLQANPELWQIVGDLAVKNMDWPGAQEMADRLKKMLPPQLQDAPDGQPQLPPQVQQQIQQGQQMIEHLTQALNAAHDKLDTKQQELESRERIAAQTNETNLAIAALKMEGANNMALLQTEIGHITDRLKLLHANIPLDNGGNEAPPQSPQSPQQPVNSPE